MIRILLILSLLSSCGNLPIAYVQNFSSVNNVVFGYPDYKISQEIFEDYDNSFIKVRFGKGPHSILILAYINDDVYEWVGIDDVKLFTMNGRVIKTIGLEHNFELINPQKNIFIDSTSANLSYISSLIQNLFGTGDKDQNISYESINLFNPNLYSVTIESSLTSSSYELVRFEKKVDAIRFKVINEIKPIGWKETNYYYKNLKSGLIERTSQHMHPRLPVANIEFYYKF